jgi:hypothetical protein
VWKLLELWKHGEKPETPYHMTKCGY